MKVRHEVRILAGEVLLCGDLSLPKSARGIVVFAHGSGTTRRDEQNRFVARRLERGGFATLLIELLEDYEARDRHNVFDVGLQAERLINVRGWLALEPRTRALQIGYFGTGVGTGVVLMAAARAPAGISAIVSRGGRPDTALDWLPRVQAPTLFIADERGVPPDWVEMAYRATKAKKELAFVPSAGHLYKEPGAIEAVADHAQRWFERWFSPGVEPAFDPRQVDPRRMAEHGNRFSVDPVSKR